MSETAPRKRMSGLKIFGIIAGALAVIALVAVFWMKAVGDRKRDDLDREMKEEIVRIRARSAARPVLAGTAQPGNAWDDYDQALAGTKQAATGQKIGVILDPKHEDKPDAALALLPRFASSVAHLRRGARKAESKKEYGWENAATMPTPSFVACNQAASFALLQARTLAKEGKGGEAVEEMLDVLQFGRDIAGDGPLISHMVGMGTAANALNEVKDLVAAGSLDPAARGTLERGLRTLSDGFPSFEDAITREIVFMESSLLREDPGFAMSLFTMSSVQQMNSWTRRSAAAGRVSWAELLKVDAEIQAEIAKTWNPVTKIMTPAFTQTGGKRGRQFRTQLHLLIAALHYQNTGEVLDLDDPFGAKLKSSIKDGALKVWSVGPDGVDDLGSGGWKSEDGKDIVLEVPRK